MPEKRTYADRAEYMREAVSKRRKKLREMARETKGSKCLICGYNKCPRALVFHHLDPSKKDFGLSVKGLTRSWDAIRAEIDKCVLLCANCHMELHDGITQLPGEIPGRKRGEIGETLSVKRGGQSRANPSRKLRIASKS